MEFPSTGLLSADTALELNSPHAGFRQACLMSSSAVPQEVFDQVTQAWAMQDYGWGERLLAEACQRHPDHWHLRTCHAAAIGYCSRFRSARAAFDRLIVEAPAGKKLHMHGLLGVEWCRIGRHDLAVPLLRVAVADGNAPAPVR
jgi:hypothetical protein